MKNKNIINAWDKCLPDSETKERMLGSIEQKYKQHKKIFVFKPAKVIATAAAFVLIIGLFNIQTVIAFFSGLFFVPGVGLTDDSSIIYYGLENPIPLTMDSGGTATIQFITKVTRNGRTELNIYIDSDYNFISSADLSHAVSISANGEVIVSNGRLFENSDSYNGKKVSYYYSNFAYEFPEIDDFPDINEFDLTVCGVETHVSLVEQPGNTAISKTNNGITLSAYKFNGIKDFLAISVHDEKADDNYKVIIPSYRYWDWIIYDERGETIQPSGFDGAGGLRYWLLKIDEKDCDRKIKGIKTQRVQTLYYPKDEIVIEIPVPKNGETIKTNIEMPIANHVFKVTEVRREGDTIYYENNAGQVIWDESKHENGRRGYINIKDFQHGSPEFEQAVANRESFIYSIWFTPTKWDMNIDTKTEMAGGEIWNFDPDAEILTFYVTNADIIQYGDFDITFD